MIIEGRIASGLDEFMLRLGHLKVLVETLPSTAGNRQRVSRRLAEELTKPVPIRRESIQDIGTYLVRKELAQVRLPDGSLKPAHSRARYKDIVVELFEGGVVRDITTIKAGASPTVWFQDEAIADGRTRSKVGAVTVDREQITNKSGVSHLVDWAVIMGIASNRLGLTSYGRALRAHGRAVRTGPSGNPYLIGPEALIFAWMMLVVDGDTFVRLLPLLAAQEAFTKADAVKTMLCVVEGLQQEVSARAGGPGSVALRALRTAKEDLGILAGRTGSRGGSASTVWHRVSSRLEVLVDLGFLEKTTSAGAPRQFDYFYRPTEVLRTVNEQLSAFTGTGSGVLSWAADHLGESMASGLAIPLVDRRCGEELLEAASLMMGPTGLHIDSFALLAASLALHGRKRLSIAKARNAIEVLAVRRPDIARLTRGYSGTRAEFASIVLPRLEAAGADVFESS